MQTQRCPHCGAENSVKRTTCFNCEKQLSSPVAVKSGGDGKGERKPAKPTNIRAPATSRWEAIEPVKSKKAPPPRPIEESITKPVEPTVQPLGGPADPPKAPSPVYVPASTPPVQRATYTVPRSTINHVRRMSVFYRELETLTRAGIDIASACRQLERHAPGQFRALAREMGQAAQTGQPITNVLEQHPNLLYPWHLGVLRAAETVGSLPDAFGLIASGYEDEWHTRAQISVHTWVYAFLFIPSILLILPFIKYFDAPIPEMGWTFPDAVNFYKLHLRITSLPVAAVILVAVLLWMTLSTMAWFQRLQQRIVLYIPLIGRVARMAALDRYLSTLSMMLRAGTPLSRAIQESAYAAGNVILTPRLLAVGKELEAGASLSQVLSRTGIFNRDTLQLAGAGEVAGSLPEMLNRSADMYRIEHQRLRKVLLKILLTLFGVLWLIIAAILFGKMLFSYFDFAFRYVDWAGE